MKKLKLRFMIIVLKYIYKNSKKDQFLIMDIEKLWDDISVEIGREKLKEEE